MSKIRTADQMLKHDRELGQYKLLVNLFGSLLKNCRDLSKWFYELVLPLVGSLRNRQLRGLLYGIFDEVSKSQRFDTLNID